MTTPPPPRHIAEPARTTPVADEVDVLVAGGGPAGVGAALAAARAGARTLLIERHGMLGGVWTAGLTNPFFDALNKGWIVDDLVSRLRQAGAWRVWHHAATFDTEIMKLTLENMFQEAGIRFWYHSLVTEPVIENGRVIGLIVESKSGREAVLAPVVVDCTGDGDVAARAGVPFTLGRDPDRRSQPMTLMFEIAGAGNTIQSSSETLYDAMRAAIDQHRLPVQLPFERANYVPWIIHLPRPDVADVQATHSYDVSAVDTRDLTRATVDCRRQAHELVEVLRHLAGCERLHLTQTAPAIGVREGRHIHGRYTLTLDDLVAGRDFDDSIATGAFAVDIHSVNGPEGDPGSRHATPVKPYGIPYRCLLPESIDGLLLAGRCISGTHEAHASYRVTGTCMAMGQAAGLAAAMSARESTPPAQLDHSLLREELRRHGVRLS